MAQRKNHEVDSWLKKPDPSIAIVLLYGPDRGMVSERARKYAQSTGIALDDAFSVTRLDASEIESDPGRLFDEVGTISMFGGRRLIWIRNAGPQKALGNAIKELAKQPPKDCVVLIEGGDLKKTSPVRTATEAGFASMALPCYADDKRALDSLIDEIMAANSLTIQMEARRVLHEQLGGDRLASRGEVEKLALYCHGRGEVTERDVMESIGDVSATSADDALNAALSGDLGKLRGAISRYQANGGTLTTLLIATMRQMHAVFVLKADMEKNGRSASSVVQAARPPLYFERKTSVERALSRLSLAQISTILERLQKTTLESRRLPALADAMIERVLIILAGTGRGRG